MSIGMCGLKAYVFMAAGMACGLWYATAWPAPVGTPWWLFAFLGVFYAATVWVLQAVHDWLVRRSTAEEDAT